MSASPRRPGMSRRDALRLGSVALAGAGLAPFARRAAADTRAPDHPAVIFVWLPGGPPHMETFDMKPDAPAEYRGDIPPDQDQRARPRRVRAPAEPRQGAPTSTP